MLLAIDAGNTQTHIGMYKDEELVEHWRLHTDRDVTVDRIATELAGLLGLRGLRLRDIDGAIVSSVVPVLSHEYEVLSERYLEGQLLMVGPGLKTGMPIRMDNPHEVGADRLVNALAAYERIGTTCISVDFGTAVNYDVVSAEGEYLGGVLAPGRRGLARRAVRARGAALQGGARDAEVDDRALHRTPHSSPGSSTASPARSTASSAASARSWARRPRRSPPAATRRSSRPTAT